MKIIQSLLLAAFIAHSAEAYNTDDHYYISNMTRNDAGLVTQELVMEQTYAASGYENIFLKKTYEYNSLGKVSKVYFYTTSTTNAAYSIEYDYDATGRVLEKRLGTSTWQYQYDARGQLRQEILPSGEVRTLEYDAFGNVAKAMVGEVVVSYQYNGHGQLKSEVSTTTGTTSYSYTNEGLLNRVTYQDGSWVDYDYDSEGRRTTIKYSSESYNTYFSYHGTTGLLSSVSGRSNGQAFTKSFTYDSFGRTKTESVTTGGRTGTTSIAYNFGENTIDTVTYPSGRRVEYSYEHPVYRFATKVELVNGSSRQTVVEDVEYGNNGLVQGYDLRSGHRYNATFDHSMGLRTQLISGKLSQTYARNNKGQVSTITDNYTASRTRRFGFTNNLELNSVKNSGYRTLESFAYGDNGDLTSINGQSPSYDSAQRLTALGSRSISYNSRGNPNSWEATSGSTYSISQDSRGLSTRYSLGSTHHYLDRDESGVLLAHRVGSTKHHYYFQGSNLLSTRNGSTGKFTDHIYLNGQLIAQYDGTLSNVVTGHLSQPIAMFSESGSMVWRGVHNGYDIEVHVTSRDLKARFPGQYDILGNGLYYNYHRDYDPSLGRYIQSDPIGLSGGLNTYGYVGANPLMGVDPLGLADIFVGVEVDLTGFWGWEGAVGIVIDTDRGLDSGFFYSQGLGVGLNVGAGVTVGFASTDIEGCAAGVDANMGPFSLYGGGSMGDGGFYVGGSVGVGVGASGNASETWTFSIEDYIEWTRDWR